MTCQNRNICRGVGVECFNVFGSRVWNSGSARLYIRLTRSRLFNFFLGILRFLKYYFTNNHISTPHPCLYFIFCSFHLHIILWVMSLGFNATFTSSPNRLTQSRISQTSHIDIFIFKIHSSIVLPSNPQVLIPAGLPVKFERTSIMVGKNRQFYNLNHLNYVVGWSIVHCFWDLQALCQIRENLCRGCLNPILDS